MIWPVIILDAPHRNQTLSSIKYNRYRELVTQEIFLCASWINGVGWAKQNNHAHALFVKSGTVFTVLLLIPTKGCIISK